MFKKLNSGKFNEQYLGEPNVVALNSSITNRAKIEANCKVVGPVERIVVNSLKEVPNESGPNGEIVYTSDKEDSRFRIFGEVSTVFNANGTHIKMNSMGDVIEITFFGTGINILTYLDTNDRSYDIYLDGVLKSPVTITGSDVLSTRNTKLNVVKSMVKGETRDWHTIKLVKNTVFSSLFYGFEILNESPELSVLSGSVYKNGYEYILENGLTLPLKPIGYTGTNGARVLTYIDPSDGIVKQAFNEVGTPAYLGATDHSNEAIVRKINFREFGRNRSDDFSTLSSTASDRAFALDDDSTTLVGKNVQYGFTNQSLTVNANSDFWILTFKGTGLDLVVENDGYGRACSAFIDGNNVGTLDPSYLNGTGKLTVCSGLSCGTHEVKIARNGGSTSWGVLDFIIYQPKKPTLPKEAVILSDYNILGDFVANTTALPTNISSGVLRKANTREFAFVDGTGGTTDWSFGYGNQDDSNGLTGVRNQTDRLNSYVEYTFLGYGFDYRVNGYGNNSTDISVEINGQAATSANFPTASFSAYGGGTFSFNPSTGSLNSAISSGTPGLVVSGLPFGLYTVRLTNKVDGEWFRIASIDIIAPSYTMNTSIGNSSLRDMREQIENKSAKVVFNGATNTIEESNNVSQVLKDVTGFHNVWVEDALYSLEDMSISGQANINRLSGEAKTYDVLVATTDLSNVGIDVQTFVKLSGKKQKDVFKE